MWGFCLNKGPTWSKEIRRHKNLPSLSERLWKTTEKIRSEIHQSSSLPSSFPGDAEGKSRKDGPFMHAFPAIRPKVFIFQDVSHHIEHEKWQTSLLNTSFLVFAEHVVDISLIDETVAIIHFGKVAKNCMGYR